YVLKPRERARALSDERESRLHLVQELTAQPLSLGLVPEDRLGQLVRNFPCEPDRDHLRVGGKRSSTRFRVSSPVSPGTPATASRARRSTSAIDASPSRVSRSGSRLAKSSAATRARSASGSWSASLSSSSAVVATRELYLVVSAWNQRVRCRSLVRPTIACGRGRR